MKTIFIKTIESGTTFPRQTGITAVPEHIDCDEKLYAFVRQRGSIPIRRFKENNPFEFHETELVDAEEFCKSWRGD